MSFRRDGWTRLSSPGNKCGARWRHVASGWEVRHCGRPTANWPYYAVDPSDPARCTVTHNGLGFRDLNAAFDAVEGVVAGRYRATNERCTGSTRRIVRPGDATQ